MRALIAMFASMFCGATPIMLRLLALSLLAVSSLASAPSSNAGAVWPPAIPIIEAPASGVARIPPSIEARERADGRWDVIFSCSLSIPARRVTVAGDFNQWNRESLAMSRGADGIWRGATTMAPGEWGYKFVVDDTNWIVDPRNPDGRDDGHGGRNSLFRLGAVATIHASDSTAGDGAINAAALGHEPMHPMYRQVRPAGGWILRYRTLRSDVESVEVLCPEVPAIAMRPVLATDVFQYWEATLPPLPEFTPYTFSVRDGAAVVRHHSLYRLASDGSPLRTPEWAKHAIWYQIMPDRFRSGDSRNDPDPLRPWTSDWYQPSEWEEKGGGDFYRYVFDRLYGGDLQGVRQKLGWLKELGVNALYFTPIFQSPSLHRYDATSYIHVEELIGVKGDYQDTEAKEDLLAPRTWSWTGSDRVFLDFLREAKAMGFRVIIDGVFNHVGTRHPAFVDVRAKGKDSRFADWFSIKSWEPFEHEGWAGFGGMPVFRKDDVHGLASEAVRQHIFDITRRWMDPDGDGDPSDGVDGWRLDVPNEVPMPFWYAWRSLVKSINPDAYIVGEIWRRADDWVDGRSFDAVMNYPFAETVIAWVRHPMGSAKRLTASEMDRQLAELRLAYPSEATFVLQNLLDSHDTDRVASMMENPDRDYNRDNRLQDGATDYRIGRPSEASYRKVRFLALLQMTYVGAPMVWYGTEVGMWGANDPSNRKPMLWSDLAPCASPEDNTPSLEQLAFYRAAIALRQSLPALRVGSFRSLLTDDARDLWIFERELDGVRVIVALNAGEREATVTLPEVTRDEVERGAWREVFATDAEQPFTPDGRPHGADFPTVRVPPMGGAVFVGEHR